VSHSHPYYMKFSQYALAGAAKRLKPELKVMILYCTATGFGHAVLTDGNQYYDIRGRVEINFTDLTTREIPEDDSFNNLSVPDLGLFYGMNGLAHTSQCYVTNIAGTFVNCLP
jgi:hypothetical protein